jgi:type VI protein secretion system component VasK
MNYKVPGIFTQEGYQGYVKSEIERQARDLADFYRRLNIEKSYERVADDILTMYKDEYVLHWEKFLGGIELEDFKDARGAYDRLYVLSVSGDTALQKLFEKVYEKRVLRIDGKEYNKPSENLGWTAKAFEALSALFAAIQEFVDATEPTPGKRFQTYVEKDLLKSIETAFSKAKKDMKTALNGVDSNLLTLVDAIMQQPITRTRDALRREARDEMNNLWKTDALAFFQANLDKKYPFERDKKAKDVTMADFATFFRPKTGKMAVVQDYVMALSKITIDQKPLVTLSDDFLKAAKVAESFQKYIKDEKFRVKFTLQSNTSDPSAIQVKVTDKMFDLKGEIGMRRANIEWVQGTPVYIRISFDRTSITPYEDTPGVHHWGLFRMLDSSTFVQNKPTEFTITWTDGLGKAVKLTLTTDESENPFPKTFFSAFKCPEKVAGE